MATTGNTILIVLLTLASLVGLYFLLACLVKVPALPCPWGPAAAPQPVPLTGQ